MIKLNFNKIFMFVLNKKIKKQINPKIKKVQFGKYKAKKNKLIIIIKLNLKLVKTIRGTHIAPNVRAK